MATLWSRMVVAKTAPVATPAPVQISASVKPWSSPVRFPAPSSAPAPIPASAPPVPIPQVGSSPSGGGDLPPVPVSYVQEGSDGGAATPAVNAPIGAYTAVLEGVQRQFSSLADASSYLTGAAQVGDRFEVLYNGASTGLKIKATDGSLISVPDAQAAQVRAMSHADVLALLQQATATASSPGSPGVWILGVIGAGAAAYAAYGRKK